MYTDASQEFLGYVIGKELGGVFEALQDNAKVVKGVHQINLLELNAVLYALDAAIDLGFRRMTIRIDNKATVAWIKNALEDKKIRLSGLYCKLIQRRLEIFP